ncbi:MAG: phosphonoacetaldehyde hydrolase [Pseudomonadota bacterium]
MRRFKAVVFDWAGTMVDFGSFAPMGVFIETFKQFGIDVSIDEARGPMGMPKRDHIAAMIATDRIAGAWRTTHGQAPSEADIDKIYEIFVPMNEKVAADYADLVPGARKTIEFLRARGMKIGSTTGYTRSIMQHVLPVAAAQGYEPDNLVCSDDLIEGRPGPLGMYKCFVELAVYPPSSVIKVDDTEPGILEGVDAGCLTVGVTLSGNEVGKTPDQLNAMSDEEIAPLRDRAAKKLRDAGADHVIDSVAQLPALINQLEAGSE